MATKYKASRDYGTRNFERDAFKVPFAGKFATVYRRKDSASLTWHMRVYVPEERINYRKSLKTIDRREAIEFAQREFINLMATQQQGLRVVSPTFMEACRAFKLHEDTELAAGTISKRTHAIHNFYVNRGIAYAKDKFPADMNTRLTDIDGHKHFADYLEWRMAKGKVKRTSVEAELVGIRLIFKHAVSNRLATDKCIPVWSFDAGELPQRKRMGDSDYAAVLRIMKAWTRKATGDVDTYNRELLHHVFLVISNTGMRTGEVLNLRNSDCQRIDREKHEVIITIRGETSKVRRTRNISVLPSFGGREAGTPINYLLRWIDTYQRHKGKDDYIFALFTKGSGLATDPFYRGYMSLREDLKTEGLEWWDAYHGRHHYGTQAIKAGHPLTLISNAMGNSPAVLAKTYAHLFSVDTSRQIAEARYPKSAKGS